MFPFRPFVVIIILANGSSGLASPLNEYYTGQDGEIGYTHIDLQLFNITFNCTPTYSPTIPTSVHQLRPSDIKVIAALGDSITAGNGVHATNVIDVLRSNRGEAWSMGGKGTLEDNIVTLPNILRKFNPDLKGYSLGHGLEGGTEAWLNVAVTGDKAEDLYNNMLMLIEKMRHDYRINVEEDWKVVTILTGGNEMCSYCENRTRFSPEKFKADFQVALDLLKAEVPRVFVNLVAMMDISTLPLALTTFFCKTMQQQLCYCAKNETTRPELKPVQLKYYEALKQIADSGRYEAEDFTVVLQPHMVDMPWPKDASGKLDPTFISHDCFHPNEKAHAGFAYILWNTMLTPVPDKPLAYPVEDEIDNPLFKCPTDDQPYLFTKFNSGP